MPRRTHSLILLPVALLAFAPRVPAQADAFRAGLKSFTIPAPSSDLIEPGPDYRVLLEPLATTNNRLVAGFLPPADLDAMRSGSGPALNRYALVEVPRRAEFTDVSADQFKQVVESLAGQFGATLDATRKEQQDEVNRRLKALGSGSTTVTLEKPVELGAFFNKPDACAYGMIMPVTTNGKTKKVVMGMTIVRVRSRLLFLYTYTPYENETSVDWTRTTDEHWSNAILEANKQ